MVASSRILAVASAFAVGASAAAVPVLRRQEDGNRWTATNYTWGCSPGGCIANFFLLGQEGFPSGAPAFDVQCSPVYVQQDWTACKNADGSDMAPESVVYAVWQKNEPTDPNQYVNIAHVYYRQEDGLYYIAQTNSTGFVPEQGASEFFDIASVLPAPESHLPPPTLTSTPSAPVTIQSDAPASDPIQSDIAAPDPVQSDIAAPNPIQSDAPASDPLQSDIAAPVPIQSDAPASDPIQSDVPTPDPVQSDAPIPSTDLTVTDPVPPAGENIPNSDDGTQDTGSDNVITPGGGPTDDPVPTQSEAPSPAPTETEPTSDDPASTPEVMSQPILAPGEASIGTIPPGGDGA
ncbi:hypothetical protein CkaCkLH20_03121 [Colletotrichum karsti]|uniref:Uncharacterized protein n=1 Tax=Colletotrichum karsti TaxID=1095194 RepID=A0A9P6I9C9_9PEZI|nr:uncharacterized protein CkaCkLH20_03121 [Colletotrichum karsti]KAF9879578.1 hypothetical protein CkaCkLH20_03121 [Colletotrichum karsti]